MDRVQVLVSGAGPVGVTAANRLAQAGIDVLLLEAQADCPQDMRASTFHPPTLEMMEQLGFRQTLEDQGLKAPIYQYRNRATGEVLAFDLGEIGDLTPYAYRLQCEQYKLARLGAERLQATGSGQTRFQRRVVHFEQDATGVTVHVEAPTAIETIRADYLIAADGGNSIVRKWLGVQFEGFTYPEKFLTLSTEWPMEQAIPGLAYVNYMADAKEWCVLLRTPTVWRVLVPTLDKDPDAVLLGDAKKSAVFDGLMGDGAAVTTHHRTIYRVNQRVAQSFDNGRVMLVGDSAHLNNPLGGFGMNSGIHDAWNLTGKLIEIFKDGAAPEPLLARFGRQRRAITNEFVQAQTKRNKAAMENSNSQAQYQAELQAILADPDRRRAYLVEQAMINSLKREEEIA